jgi:hypothetical protein
MIASLKMMVAILHALEMFVADLFKSRRRLVCSAVISSTSPRGGRHRLRGSGRAPLVRMTRLWPSLLG